MEQARSIMNHAVGKSRGIKCGDNYNCIEEIKDPKAEKTPTPETPKIETPKDDDQNDSPIPEPVPEQVSSEASYQKVEGKSGEHITIDEAKQSRKKSKKFSY